MSLIPSIPGGSRPREETFRRLVRPVLQGDWPNTMMSSVGRAAHFSLHQTVQRPAPEPPGRLWRYARAGGGATPPIPPETAQNPSGCRPAAQAPESSARTRTLGLKRQSRAPVDRSRRERLQRISPLIQRAAHNPPPGKHTANPTPGPPPDTSGSLHTADKPGHVPRPPYPAGAACREKG